jgi:hypothetical protein
VSGELREEDLEVAKSKFVRGREEAEKILGNLPQQAELILFSSDAGKLVEEAVKMGLEVVAVIPLVDAVVVRGPKGALIRIAASNLVERVDVPRKVRALSGHHDS